MRVIKENGVIYAVMGKYDRVQDNNIIDRETSESFRICEHTPFHEVFVEIPNGRASLRSEIEFELGVR